MDYRPIVEARTETGLRLVLTGGVPGPWSEAAKGLFWVRNVPYIPVLQRGGEANEELVAWTGHRNAPTAIYNDEPPRVTALDMVNLAERLGEGPSLLPDDVSNRVLLFGMLNEIAGEGGLAWNARVLMFRAMTAAMSADTIVTNPMLREYHYRPEDATHAPARIIAILQALAGQLHSQGTATGSLYFIADRLSALDIYWACFSQMFYPLPAEVNPMPQFLRDMWGCTVPALKDAGYQMDPILLAHRDYIFPQYLQWPLDY
jgi:hypothetical protein